MPRKGVSAVLGGWEGYRVETVARFEAGELRERSRTPQVPIDLIRRLEAVAMDMSAAFEAQVRAQCPQAKRQTARISKGSTVSGCGNS